jgi:hypothetical protein
MYGMVKVVSDLVLGIGVLWLIMALASVVRRSRR